MKRKGVHWDSARPDLSKLPPEIKDQLDPLPLGNTETRAKITIFRNPHFQGLSHPTGRLFIAAHQPNAEIVDQYEGLILQLVDFTGHTPLACAVVNTEQAAILFQGLITEYRRSGGDLQNLQKLLEETINGTDDGDDESSNFSDVQPYGTPRE